MIDKFSKIYRICTKFISNKRIPVNIIISSGGSRGYAAFAIFEKIIEYYGNEIEIKEMAGSSIGAVLVGIFGKAERRKIESLHEYKKFFSRMTKKQFLKLYAPADPRRGLVSHSRIKKFFYEELGIMENIEDLDVKVTIAATRIPQMKVEYLREGPLIDAIMCSISIPGIFPSYIYKGNHYLDGGIRDPIPWRAIRNEKYAKNIVIDLYGGRTHSYKNNYKENIYNNLMISLDALLEEISALSIREIRGKENWFIFSPFANKEVKVYSTFDFVKFKEIYKIGLEEWEAKQEIFEKWLRA